MIVEDGTGLTDADSYVDIDFADNYISSRGLDEVWKSKTSDEKEQALIMSTDYVDNLFKWHGKRLTVEQSLSYPRKELVDYDGYEVIGVPLRIKQAVCDACIEYIQGNALFTTNAESGAIKSEQVGSIKIEYATSKINTDISLYNSINKKLRGLLVDTSKSVISWSRIIK